MTFRHFQIFVSVCDTMNMTSAANKLYMSQSAVSQAIADLERHYQTHLFERLGKKLYLTHAGDVLAGYARHILRMNLDAEQDLRNLNQSGTLRIGASVTIASTLLPELVSAIHREQPGVRLELKEENTRTLEGLILADKLDIGLAEGETHSPDIIKRPFATDALLLVCGPTHPFASRAYVTKEELAEENFILREHGSGTRSCFEASMARLHLPWKSNWTCSNTESIKNALIEGLGISTLSERAIVCELSEGTLHPFTVEGLAFPRQFQLIYHKNKYLTIAMKQFIRLCFRFGEFSYAEVEGLP